MSIVIDTDGQYVRDENGRLKKTDHRAYQARVELALAKGSWLHAPNNGHNLDRFKREKMTPVNVEEFEKEVVRYLSKYDPEVTERVRVRSNFVASIDIDDGV